MWTSKLPVVDLLENKQDVGIQKNKNNFRCSMLRKAKTLHLEFPRAKLVTEIGGFVSESLQKSILVAALYALLNSNGRHQYTPNEG